MSLDEENRPVCGVRVRTLYGSSTHSLLHPADGRKVLVMFHSQECGWCELTLPELRRASMFLCGDVSCITVDVDHYDELADTYEVEGLPTIALLEGGKLLKKVEGFHEYKQIVAFARGLPIPPRETEFDGEDDEEGKDDE